MKHVGILAYSFADNYGAVLQCYALYKKCEELGVYPYVIRYKPYKMISLKSRIKKIILGSEQQKNFEVFRKENLKWEKKVKREDIIIVGSDQVWNPLINKYDDMWYMPKWNVDKIYAYAASFGKATFSSKEESYLWNHKDNFQKYKKITVREESAVDFFDGMAITAYAVCDPTLFFYDRYDIYRNMEQKSKLYKKNGFPLEYILVYSLEYSYLIDDIAQKNKGREGAIIVSMHPSSKQMQYSDLFIEESSPYDFLYLIDHCKLIITNSYHGLLFACIFRKHVICVEHNSLADRQIDFIEKSGYEYKQLSDGAVELDFSKNSEQLRTYISKSVSLLGKMLES